MALRTAFEGWSPHFRARLQDKGLPDLLARYEAVIESVDTRSCLHGPNGTRQTGEAWRWCCGVSYEHWNNISVRRALDIIFEVVGEGSLPEVRASVAALDDRLYALYDPPPLREGQWWCWALPKNIAR